MVWTGNVQFTVLDGQAGLYSGPANSVQAVIGCCSGGTAGQVVPTSSLSTLTSTIGYGPLVEACGLVIQAGGTVLAVKAPTVTAGAIGGVTAISGGITGATNASPTVITVGSTATITTGSVVTIAAVGGNTGANGTWVATVVSATTFSIAVDTSGGSAFTSGGTVTPTGAVATMAGTAAPYYTGTPTDDFYAMVVCQTGFTVGTTGGTILVSLDAGRTFGAPIAVGTATTISLKDTGGMDSGLVLHLGSSTKTWTGGGVVNGAPVGDYVRCHTTAPQPDNAGIQAGLQALVNYLAGSSAAFPLVQVVGAMAASEATAIESGGSMNLDLMASAQYRFVRAIGSSRDAHPPAAWGGQAAETEAAWEAAVILDYSATTATRVCPSAGYYNMTTAFATQFAGAPSYRRPLSFALGARCVAIAPQRHPAKVGGAQGGAISQIIVNPARDPSDGFIYHNESQGAVFNYLAPAGVGRFASARTVAGKPGMFFSQVLTLAPPGSDFTMLPKAIVMDVACVAAYGALVDFEYADLTTNANGTLSDAAAATVKGSVSDAMTAILLSAGMISGFSVVVDQTQNIQTTQTLVVTISILGVIYVLQTNVSIGYTSALVAAPAAA